MPAACGSRSAGSQRSESFARLIVTAYRILYHHRIRAEDGQAVHVRELITALRELGHRVDECALVPKSGVPGARANGGAAGGKLWRRLKLPRVAVECLEVGYDRAGVRMLERAGRTAPPDFVYERHALHCRAGLKAARQLGVPFVLEVNSPMCDEMERLGLLRWPRRARRTEREVLASADAVLAVTDVLRDRLVECGAAADRTEVIGNAAVPDRYGDSARDAGRELRARLGLDAGRFVVGFIGFAREWHRLDLAVEQLVREDLAGVDLVLVGDGPALPEVRARAAQLGVDARVHTIGAVGGDRVPGCVMAFDAALIPAINSYASPLKLFDSLAAGIVTIAPRQPNLEEYLADGVDGILFEDGTLGDRIAELSRDRARATRIGEAGAAKLRARDWTWRGNAGRVIAVFERLRARRSA